MKRKTYKPASHGSASICTWNISFHFYTKEQRDKAIKLILKRFEQAELNTWVEPGDSVTPSKYYISIENYSWANNLTDLGRLLEKCDYYMG